MNEIQNPYTPPTVEVESEIKISGHITKDQEVGVLQYVVRFAVVFLVLLFGLGVLLGYLGMNSGSGVTIGALVVSALFAVTKFMTDNRRLPTQSERRRLVWMSFIASWFVSFIPFGVFVTLDDNGRKLLDLLVTVDVWVVAAVVVFLSMFYLGFLSLAYGYLARKQFEAQRKKGKL